MNRAFSVSAWKVSLVAYGIGRSVLNGKCVHMGRLDLLTLFFYPKNLAGSERNLHRLFFKLCE